MTVKQFREAVRTEPSLDLTGKQDLVRMSFNLPRDYYEQLDRILHWGQKNAFISKIIQIAVDQIMDCSEDEAKYILGAMMCGEFNPIIRKE